MFCSVASPDAFELPMLETAKTIANIETISAALDLNALFSSLWVSKSMLLLLNFLPLWKGCLRDEVQFKRLELNVCGILAKRIFVLLSYISAC